MTMGSTSRARRGLSAGAAVLTVALVLVGCVQPRNSPVGRYRVMGIWTDMGELGLQRLLPGTTITLAFTADGRLSGQACNGYGGSWTWAARGEFEITGLHSTDMACLEPEGVMRQEARYFERLQLVRGITAAWVAPSAPAGTVNLVSGGEPNRPIIELERV
jgi:hypothetical protein